MSRRQCAECARNLTARRLALGPWLLVYSRALPRGARPVYFCHRERCADTGGALARATQGRRFLIRKTSAGVRSIEIHDPAPELARARAFGLELGPNV